MQIEDSQPRWGILFGLLFLLGNLALLPFFLIQPKIFPPLNVQNSFGEVELFSLEEKKWIPLEGATNTLAVHQRVRTGPGGELDLVGIGGKLFIRLKENSKVHVRKPHLLQREASLRIYLEQGTLLGMIQNPSRRIKFQISTPLVEVSPPEGIFQVRSKPEGGESWVSMLKGSAEIRSRAKRRQVTLRSHEKTHVQGKSYPFKPSTISQEDWTQMKEAYGFSPPDVEFEERQSRLAKEAGLLFSHISEGKVFFDPNLGYLERAFVKDPESGQIQLKMEYDVFPSGSFVGMALKTEDLDLGKFSRFSFKGRSEDEESFPHRFRIEIKSGQKVLWVFHPALLTPLWKDFEYAFQVPEGSLVSEITFVFSNEMAGPQKRGVIYLRELALSE